MPELKLPSAGSIEPFEGQKSLPKASIKLPDLLQGYLDRRQMIRARSKEQKQTLAQNEIALERMSSLCWRLHNLVDDSNFRSMEHSYTNHYEGGSSHTGYTLSIPAAEAGYKYQIDIDRDPSGKAYRVGVYTHADGGRTTGRDDGRWSIRFHEVHQATGEKRGMPRLEMSESEIEGDFYLGKETAEVIERIGVDSRRTNLHLKGVDFGGYPSAHVWLQAWGEDTKNKKSIVGPIGNIRKVHVLGISRAVRVTEGHISDTSSTDYDITDDFGGKGISLVFDRGDMDMAIVKQKTPDGKEILNIAFSGIRTFLAGLGLNGERMIEDRGREMNNFSIPRDMLNGHTVLDMLDHCVTNLEVAVMNKQSSSQLPNPGT